MPTHDTLVLQDDSGYIDTVTLRDATVLEPGGSRLTSGLAVAIVGHPDGNAFVADEVDAVPADAAPADDILPASDAGAASYDVPTGAAYGTPYVGPDPVRRPQPVSRSNGPGYATGTAHPSYGQTFRAAPPAQPARRRGSGSLGTVRRLEALACPEVQLAVVAVGRSCGCVTSPDAARAESTSRSESGSGGKIRS